MCIVDTPLAKYFEGIGAQDLDDMNIEIIRNSLYKAYLEDFMQFCNQNLGGASAEVMQELLAFEADRRVITITLNALNSPLTKEARAKLFPQLGQLYPDGHAKLSRCDDVEQVKSVIDQYPTLRTLFDSVGSGQQSSALLQSAMTGASDLSGLDDAFFAREVQNNKLTFMHQSNYAVFYSFVKLREQEVRNIVWIAECISQGQRDKINNYVPIF